MDTRDVQVVELSSQGEPSAENSRTNSNHAENDQAENSQAENSQAENSQAENSQAESDQAENSRAENDQEQVTALIPSRIQAKSGMKVTQAIEDDGLEVVAVARRKDAATSGNVESMLAEENTAVAIKQPEVFSRWDGGSVARLRAEFLHTCLPLLFGEQPIQSLGITSALAGEGKTSLAWIASQALASSSRKSVVLVECDWERPTFSRDLGLPASPGLAEYLLGESDRAEIRRPFLPNLTVIPAGLGGADALMALAQLQGPELYDRLADPDELMILDLPSLLGSYYGTVAARLAESLLLVVRAGATSASLVSSACEELSHLRVEGIILNRVRTRIPRWLQRLL